MAQQVLVGAGVGTGFAVGRAYVVEPRTAAEIAKGPGARIGLVAIRDAIEQVATELESTDASSEAAEVLSALAMIIRDPALFEKIKTFLAEGVSGQQAVIRAFEKFAVDLRGVGGYFADRADDLTQLAARVNLALAGDSSDVAIPDEPFVLVTSSLSPMDAARLDPAKVLAVVTKSGSATSHSAIIVRAAALPTVMSVAGLGQVTSGANLLVDATSGQVFVEPTDAEIECYRNSDAEAKAALDDSIDLSSLTAPVPLLANLGSSFEADAALKSGAEGVGLFRTELLFLERETPPTLAEQVFEYSQLLAKFDGCRVIARVLDVDVDKPLPFLKSIGSGAYADRGLQVLLANEEVLRTQLEALAKAQEHYPSADLWVMAPMVTAAADAARFASLARAAGLGRVGAMIEVPEVAETQVLVEILASVDFLSIGTNDLTQYTLGKSRHTESVTLADTRDSRVLNLIEGVIATAKAAGKPVGICGEAAADFESARLFIEFGADSLSGSAALLPALRLALSQSQKNQKT